MEIVDDRGVLNRRKLANSNRVFSLHLIVIGFLRHLLHSSLSLYSAPNIYLPQS